MSLKQRLRTLSGRQWLTLWAASIVVSVIGSHLAHEWSPLATGASARLALDAFGIVMRVLPAAIVGLSVGSGALPSIVDGKSRRPAS